LTFCFFCVKAKEEAPQGNGTMTSYNALKINQQNSANDAFSRCVTSAGFFSASKE
jgi:hypothetical protein